jgi:two-component system, cell cycle response regulator
MENKTIRVLVIEDNPLYCRMVSNTLSEVSSESHMSSFELSSVDELSKGITRLADGNTDIVLLDLSLPDSNGLDTLLRIRSQAPDTPIVVLTGLDDESTALQAVQAGAQDYLVKGQMDKQMLARAIRYAIERQRLLAALRSLSLIDDLTGLYNRRGFLTLGEQHVKLSRRTNRHLIVMYADIDNMKYINDTFGHREGDLALIKTAEILKETYRGTDIVARMGGDEFTVLAVNAADYGVDIISNRLRENIRNFNALSPTRYNLQLSLGFASFAPENDMSIEEMVAQADKAQYEDKRSKQKTEVLRSRKYDQV